MALSSKANARCVASAERTSGSSIGLSRTKVVSRAAAAADVPKVTALSATDYTELGRSGLKVPVLGVGAWSWGDRSGYWGYGSEYGKDESRAAFKAIVEAGLGWIDTAEVYGFGKSEEFLGEFMKEMGPAGDAVQVATKFGVLPWRLTADSVPVALKASLQRLQRSKVELYMQHWPGFALNAFSNDAFLEGLIRCKEQGLTDAVGVSNFNEKRIKGAVKRLAQNGIPLASNQVQYSLLYRAPERNGVLEACREDGVTLVAYSPLNQGLLTGKYKVGGAKPYGPRAAIFDDGKLRALQPLLDAMKAVGDEHGGKTLTQVALNWCICKGTMPIPGVKSARQLEEVSGALGWRLSEGEVRELDVQSGKLQSLGLGAPFENW